MSAARGYLATIEPCAATAFTPCGPHPLTSAGACANCQGSGTRLVLHADTPAIAIEVVKEIIADVPCPYVCEHAFEAAMDLLREGIETT